MRRKVTTLHRAVRRVRMRRYAHKIIVEAGETFAIEISILLLLRLCILIGGGTGYALADIFHR